MTCFRLLLAAALVVGLALLVAARHATAALNALAPRSAYTLSEGLAYGALARQRMDVYRPVGAMPAGGWPVVVFFYGGSWNRGERADYRFAAAALASRGLLVLVPDYRLYPEVRYPAFVEDSARAVVHGLAQAASLGGNPHRLFVMGHSAGAYNAAMVAFDARWLRALGHDPAELAGFIGLAGPYDFLPMTNPQTRPVFFHPDVPPGTQPIAHVTRTAPRSFIGAARADTLVNPQRNSVGLAQRLRADGVPVTLKLYRRVDHATLVAALAAPLRWLAPVLDDVDAFVTAQHGVASDTW